MILIESNVFHQGTCIGYDMFTINNVMLREIDLLRGMFADMSMHDEEARANSAYYQLSRLKNFKETEIEDLVWAVEKLNETLDRPFNRGGVSW